MATKIDTRIEALQAKLKAEKIKRAKALKDGRQKLMEALAGALEKHYSEASDSGRLEVRAWVLRLVDPALAELAMAGLDQLDQATQPQTLPDGLDPEARPEPAWSDAVA